jgi:hypothetical protein
VWLSQPRYVLPHFDLDRSVFASDEPFLIEIELRYVRVCAPHDRGGEYASICPQDKRRFRPGPSRAGLTPMSIILVTKASVQISGGAQYRLRGP